MSTLYSSKIYFFFLEDLLSSLSLCLLKILSILKRKNNKLIPNWKMSVN